MPVSAVAGILDKGGGIRVVVGPDWELESHIGESEQLFVVKDFYVWEPVAWNEIPYVIARAQRAVLEGTMKDNPCGGCHVCCYLTYIPSINKPSHTHCRECIIGAGCSAYKLRPRECQVFECSWLASQKGPYPMAQKLRPDRCGVMFLPDTTNGENDLFEVHVQQMSDVAQEYIDKEQRKGRRAKLITNYYGERK